MIIQYIGARHPRNNCGYNNSTVMRTKRYTTLVAMFFI
jgi:hypothetical protein